MTRQMSETCRLSTLAYSVSARLALILTRSRLCWGNKFPFFSPKGASVPGAVSVFPDELYAMLRSWAERAYPNLIYFNKAPKGGHFAAWEQPELLVHDLREGFRKLRSA
jgi:pimeloyl-ACP methyl ester carboxylesterase